MSDLDETARRAVDKPIRTPPPLEQLLTAVARRRHRRRFAGAVAGVALIIIGVVGAVTILGGSEDAARVDTAAATAAPSEDPDGTPNASPSQGDAPILDADSLVSALADLGADVVDADPPARGFFNGAARGLCVNGSQLRVFEYPTVSDRAAESESITADGQPDTFTFASWIGPPRFFAAGTLIALDLSGDAEIENLLSTVMGPTLSPDGLGRGSGNNDCGVR